MRPGPIRGRVTGRIQGVSVFQLGRKVHWFRQQHGYTLKTVSRATGLSPGLLSLVENDQVVPPIGTLLRIAQFFGVPLGRFFEDPPSGSVAVVRKHERRPVDRRPSRGGRPVGYRYLSLGYKKNPRSIEPYYVEFSPKSVDDVVHFDHRGQEFVYVLSGRLEFSSPNEVVALKPGDSLMFDSRIAHGFRSIGSKSAHAVVTVVEAHS